MYMKTFLGFVGAVLIIGVIAGGTFSELSDWSTGELVGYNVVTLVFLIGGGYLIYRAFKRKEKASPVVGENSEQQAH